MAPTQEYPTTHAAMAPQTLHTRRLILRPLRKEDAAHVWREISGMPREDFDSGMPYPYTLLAAERFIERAEGCPGSGFGMVFAITLERGGRLIGAVDLRFRGGCHGDLGYWVGVDWRKRGYATEAVGAVLAFGFTRAGLRYIEATSLVRNLASLRVLSKVGLLPSRIVQLRVKREGPIADVVICGRRR